jgi:predicted O-linked N-acetylglucosamine transferase (SPINDLY family)
MSAAGATLDYSFSPLSRSRSRRIRVGILCSDFSARSETFVAIPFFRHLDRTRFETLLLSQHRFAIDSHSSALAKLVDHAIVLPRDLNQQVLLIRGLQLDALVIGTNITAVQSTTFLLTLHRLAPVQIANCCSPTSTGNPVIDYFLSGSLAEGSAKPETLYSENLLMLQGTGLCFDYSFDQTKPARIDRTKLGISQDMIVFTSGANMNKIGPEVRRAWAHILSRTPNSVLILYPYGTAWQRSYPRKAFEAEMRSALAQAGVEEKRIRFLNALSSRSNVKAVLRLSDVYLDSFPYGGANTMIDPLELGIPSVAMRGPYQRFNQGAAILDDLGIPDLAANDAEDYCRLAVTLGTKPMIRKQLSKVIKDNIKEVPKFLNTVDYGSQLGSLLTKICRP